MTFQHRPNVDYDGLPYLDTGTTGPLRFKAPESYSGKQEDFLEFSFKFKAYLNLSDKDFGNYMAQAEHATTTIRDHDYVLADGTPDQNALKLSRELFNALVCSTSGQAATMLRQLSETEENGNGFEAWRRLYEKARLHPAAKAFKHLTKILKPNFGDDQTFDTKFETWESEIAAYEKLTTTPVSTDLKIAILLEETRGPLLEHIQLMCLHPHTVIHRGTVKAHSRQERVCLKVTQLKPLMRY